MPIAVHDKRHRNRVDWLVAGAILLLAFILRLIPVVIHPSLNWGDEVYQTTEQAHRLVYGTGLVPWEFQRGIRSWILPGALALVMEAARLFGSGPQIYLPAIASALGLLAIVPVLCTYLWAKRVFGFGAGGIAAFVVATAPELVYFGDRALAEIVAGHLLVLATYLLLPGFPVRGRARGAVAGGVLALALLLRVQIAPAILLLIAWAGWQHRHRPWWTMAGGFAAVFIAGGALDAVTLGAPFASLWRYVRDNLIHGVSLEYGTQPLYYYALAELAIWGAAIIVPIALCSAGIRRWALPAGMAAVLIAAHSVIAHKEQRFIYPALLFLAVQAGWGAARLWADAGKRIVRFAPAGAFAAAAVLAWRGPGMSVLRDRVHDQITASESVSAMKGVCGIGLYRPGPDGWAPYGGYTYLHLNVPLYWPEDGNALARMEPAFNLLIAPRTTALRGGFEIDHCAGTICVSRRTGPCDGRPMQPMPVPHFSQGS